MNRRWVRRRWPEHPFRSTATRRPRRSASTHPMRNSLDAVASRDFALEYLSSASIAATHLSRLAEEIVLWATPAFGFVKLSDAFTTGSSIMPQKRNPDAAELVRAKTGRILGSFVALTTVMKGLALAYAKDLQEDKEAVFSAADALDLSLAAMAGMIDGSETQRRRHAPRRRSGLSHRHRSGRLAGDARSRSRSARRITSRARS